jgi:hypothetical protein
MGLKNDDHCERIYKYWKQKNDMCTEVWRGKGWLFYFIFFNQLKFFVHFTAISLAACTIFILLNFSLSLCINNHPSFILKEKYSIFHLARKLFHCCKCESSKSCGIRLKVMNSQEYKVFSFTRFMCYFFIHFKVFGWWWK